MRSWPALLMAGTGIGRPDDPTTELLHAALMDFAVAAIDEPSADSLRAFFHDAEERDRALSDLRARFPPVALSAVDVPDENWAARSQANLKAVHVGDIVVAPPWDATPQPDALVIVIQPSMGFGTGHHATTRLCLAALQHARVRGRSVIDVGTGSGVLAIAASRLGASPVIGIDHDPDAIQSAVENIALNPGVHVDFRIGDLRSSILGTADLVFANLTGTLLVQAATELQALLSPKGTLILSGLMDREEDAVAAAFPGLTVRDRSQEDEWVCLVMTREQSFQ